MLSSLILQFWVIVLLNALIQLGVTFGTDIIVYMLQHTVDMAAGRVSFGLENCSCICGLGFHCVAVML